MECAICKQEIEGVCFRTVLPAVFSAGAIVSEISGDIASDDDFLTPMWAIPLRGCLCEKCGFVSFFVDAMIPGSFAKDLKQGIAKHFFPSGLSAKKKTARSPRRKKQ